MRKDGSHVEVSIFFGTAKVIQKLVSDFFRRLFVGSPLIHQLPEEPADLPILDHHSVVAFTARVVALKAIVELEGHLAGRHECLLTIFKQPLLLKSAEEPRRPFRIIRRNNQVIHLLRLEDAKRSPVCLLLVI